MLTSQLLDVTDAFQPVGVGGAARSFQKVPGGGKIRKGAPSDHKRPRGPGDTSFVLAAVAYLVPFIGVLVGVIFQSEFPVGLLEVLLGSLGTDAQ